MLTPPISAADVGKRFRTRGGGVVKVIHSWVSTLWRVRRDDGGEYDVSENGHFYSPPHESPNDLISRIEEPEMEPQTGDPVNHPPHYNVGGIEVIDAIEAWQLSYHLGNVVKYVARARHKGNELEDLKKARWYLDRAIERLQAPPPG